MVDVTIISAQLLCVSVLSLVILFIFRKIKSNRYLQIPGPKGIPLIGNFLQIDKMDMHITLDKWGYEYGEMVHLKLLRQNVLVINSSEIARELYLHEPMATLTAGRIHTFISKYIMDDADVIFSTYSNEWNHRRKIAHQLLRTYGEGLHEIENQLTLTLDNMEERIKETENMAVNPSEIINEFLLENLEVMVSGKRGKKELQKCFLEMDHTCNHLSTPGIERILTKFPWIRYLPCSVSDSFKRCLAARSRMMDILQNMQNCSNTSGIHKRLMNIVIEEEKNGEKRITKEIATHILHDLVAAGYITTYGSLMSILKILISRPDVQTKIQEEITEIIGTDRLPKIKDRQRCHYTQAVILETLRYISHLPLTCHCAIADFQFRDVNIPEGCAIFVNTWHIHHNEKEFEDPFQFKPERFLDDDGTLLDATHQQRRRLWTFGIGRRSCIGEVLAQSRMFLFLVHIMQHYTVCPPTKEDIPLFHPTEMKPGLVLNPTDYKCKFIPRA